LRDKNRELEHCNKDLSEDLAFNKGKKSLFEAELSTLKEDHN
jgi:hypothetical protein